MALHPASDYGTGTVLINTVSTKTCMIRTPEHREKNLVFNQNFFQIFPRLLKTLMEKDYGPAIRSGFQTTGLYPISIEKAIAKLPAEVEEREVETAVHRELLRTLSDMRYNAPANKAAARPKKNQKLPPGASYTCVVAREEDEEETETSDSKDSSDDDGDNVSISSVDSEEERSSMVSHILAGLDEDLEGEIEDMSPPLHSDKDRESGEELPDPTDTAEEDPAAVDPDYPVKSFVIAVYQDQWYLGQVLCKEAEPEAEESDRYVLLSFMERNKDKNSFKWPNRMDMLNMLKDDILFCCQPPTPGASTSSSRVNSFELSKEDFNKANKLFQDAQASYPTKILSYLSSCVCVSVYGDRLVPVLYVGVCVHVCVCVCVCVSACH